MFKIWELCIMISPKEALKKKTLALSHEQIKIIENASLQLEQFLINNFNDMNDCLPLPQNILIPISLVFPQFKEKWESKGWEFIEKVLPMEDGRDINQYPHIKAKKTEEKNEDQCNIIKISELVRIE